MTSILGISAFYHDSAAALIVDGDIVAAAQEERFSRKKHDPRYPFNAIKYVLKETNLELSEVDHIVFFEKPFLKFERLLETYMAFAPKGFKSFSMSMPLWLKEKLFQKKFLFDKEGPLDLSGPLPKEKSPKEATSQATYQMYPDRFWIVLTVGLSNVFDQMQFSAYPILIKLVAKYYQQVIKNESKTKWHKQLKLYYYRVYVLLRLSHNKLFIK